MSGKSFVNSLLSGLHLTLRCLLPGCLAGSLLADTGDSGGGQIPAATVEQFSSLVAGYLQIPALPAELLPRAFDVSQQQLVDMTCPETPTECSTKVAIFDQRYHHLLLSTDLRTRGETLRLSFLVHELVHVYQQQRSHTAVINQCQRHLQNEREAYRLQDRFLSDNGINLVTGQQLFGALCSPSRPPDKESATLKQP